MCGRLRATWCSALTGNNGFSCKRHQFPRLRPAAAAHSTGLWQLNAYIALTVFKGIKSVAEAVSELVVSGAVTGRRVKVETQRRLFGDLKIVNSRSRRPSSRYVNTLRPSVGHAHPAEPILLQTPDRRSQPACTSRSKRRVSPGR